MLLAVLITYSIELGIVTSCRDRIEVHVGPILSLLFPQFVIAQNDLEHFNLQKNVSGGQAALNPCSSQFSLLAAPPVKIAGCGPASVL